MCCITFEIVLNKQNIGILHNQSKQALQCVSEDNFMNSSPSL